MFYFVRFNRSRSDHPTNQNTSSLSSGQTWRRKQKQHKLSIRQDKYSIKTWRKQPATWDCSTAQYKDDERRLEAFLTTKNQLKSEFWLDLTGEVVVSIFLFFFLALKITTYKQTTTTDPFDLFSGVFFLILKRNISDHVPLRFCLISRTE